MLTNALKTLFYELYLKKIYRKDNKTVNIIDNFLYF